MTDAAVPVSRFTPDTFSASRVISKASAVFLQNLVPFLAIAAAVRLPPVLFQAFAAPRAASDPTVDFVALFLIMLGQALIVPGTIAALRGRRVGLAAAWTIARSRLLPITGLAAILVAALCVMLGLAFVVASALIDHVPTVGILVGLALAYVPGLMLFITCFVAVPVCVTERLGPFASIGRSRALTKGCRWRIFGLTLLVFIPAFLVSGLIIVAARLPVTEHLLELAWSTIWSAFLACLVTSVHHDLRVAKEGVDTDSIPAVFD